MLFYLISAHFSIPGNVANILTESSHGIEV